MGVIIYPRKLLFESRHSLVIDIWEFNWGYYRMSWARFASHGHSKDHERSTPVNGPSSINCFVCSTCQAYILANYQKRMSEDLVTWHDRSHALFTNWLSHIVSPSCISPLHVWGYFDMDNPSLTFTYLTSTWRHI